MGRRTAQRVGDLGRDVPQHRGIAGQPFGLFGQAIAQRRGPRDIGAPVHVVADPGREAERLGRELAPVAGKAFARRREQLRGDPVARGLRPAHRGHRRGVFGVERDRVARMRRDAGRAFADLPARSRGGDRGGLGLRQQEGRVTGEHDMRARDAPAGRERREVLRRAQGIDPRGVRGRIERREQVRARSSACSSSTPSHSSSATSVSSSASESARASSRRDSSSPSWNTGLNSGVSAVRAWSADSRASSSSARLTVRKSQHCARHPRFRRNRAGLWAPAKSRRRRAPTVPRASPARYRG